jgi:hypothetical protein
VAIGQYRGIVARNSDQLAAWFVPYEIGSMHTTALRRHPDLAWPIVQKYFPLHEIDVVSVAGCLDGDSRLHGLGHSRKLRALPAHLGVGTRFEAVGVQEFTDRAVAAVRSVLGRGLFELEVLVHHSSGEAWTIDLNPRGFGQIALEVHRGNDLPALWYESVTGVRLNGSTQRRHRPRYWQAGVHYYVGAAVALATGPQRKRRLGELAHAVTQPRVGPFLDWGDPAPALHSLFRSLRHPRALVKRYMAHRPEIERAGWEAGGSELADRPKAIAPAG